MTRPGKAFAALAAVALLTAGCASRTGDGGTDTDSGLKNLPVQTSIDVPADAVTAAGDGKAECADGTTIGYAGAMTGPNAQLGINIYNGVQRHHQHNVANPTARSNSEVRHRVRPEQGRWPGPPVITTTRSSALLGCRSRRVHGDRQDLRGRRPVRHSPSADQPGSEQERLDHLPRGMVTTTSGPRCSSHGQEARRQKVYVVGVRLRLRHRPVQDLDPSPGQPARRTDKINRPEGLLRRDLEDPHSTADTVFCPAITRRRPFDQQLVAKGFKGAFIGPDGSRTISS